MVQPKPPSPLPTDPTTVRGRSLFNVAPLYLAIGDQLEALLSGLCLDQLQVAGASLTGTVLAMITIFQFAEGLGNQQAAAAAGTRLDWKYAMHLPMDHPRPKSSELDDYHRQLQASAPGKRVFQELLGRLEPIGLWRRGSLDAAVLTADRVLSSVCALNRLERGVATISAALQALAAKQPEWLLKIVPPYWYDRYGQAPSRCCLPTAREQQEALMNAIEADRSYLSAAIEQADLPDVAMLPEVRALRQTWEQESALGAAQPHPRESMTDSQ